MKLISVKPVEEQLPDDVTDVPVCTYLTTLAGAGLFVVVRLSDGDKRLVCLDNGWEQETPAMRHYKVIPPASEVTFRV